MARKRKLNQHEAKKLLPVIRKFNELAKEFLRTVGGQIDEKEKRISVLLQELPSPQNKHNINVQAVDIAKTLATSKKGKFAGNITHKWEKDVMQELRRKIII